MIAISGTIDSIDTVHDAVRRMEERAARHYDLLAAAAELMMDKDSSTTLRSLAAAARRRARTFSGGGAKTEADTTPPPPLAADDLELGPWRVMELALDMEYSMLSLLEVLGAAAEDGETRAEADKLAERKRLHLAELQSRQSRHPAPPGFQD